MRGSLDDSRDNGTEISETTLNKKYILEKKKSLEKSQTASALKKGKKQKLIVFKMSEDQISIDTTL